MFLRLALFLTNLLPAAGVDPGAPTSVPASGPATSVSAVDAITGAVDKTVASGQTVLASVGVLVFMGVGSALAIRRGRNALAIAQGVVFVVAGFFIVFQPHWMLDIVRSFSDSLVTKG